MMENLSKALPVILPVSLLTGIVYLVLPRLMLDKAAIGTKSLAAAALQTGLGWVVGSAIFGAIFVAIYLWVGERWPGMQMDIFLKLGIITFIGFTLLAFVTCPLLKMSWRIPVYTYMNLVWAAGYGWFLPHLLK